MKDRTRTLLLYANGAGWKDVLADTVIRGVLRIKRDRLFPSGWSEPELIRKLMGRQRYETLSYVDDWMDAFCEAPELDITICNTSNLVEFYSHRNAIREYPLIIILHSAAGDNMRWLLSTSRWFQERRGKLLIFIGNEYSLLLEKLRFIRNVEADYIGSQLPIEAAQWLYSECEHTEVIATPHALNPKIYSPDHQSPRSTDIGFIGSIYPYFIGDEERTNLIYRFKMHGAELGLQCDIREQRLPRMEWARFLNNCKGIIGAESGTYYLEKNGETINQVRVYMKSRPQASFEEVFELFFKNYPNKVSGKAISSRHFEPIGTHTCQMLTEGHYNGILDADEHYISLNKDLSNILDAVERFKDDEYRNKMTSRVYEYVMDGHTYTHRVKSLLQTVL